MGILLTVLIEPCSEEATKEGSSRLAMIHCAWVCAYGSSNTFRFIGDGISFLLTYIIITWALTVPFRVPLRGI